MKLSNKNLLNLLFYSRKETPTKYPMRAPNKESAQHNPKAIALNKLAKCGSKCKLIVNNNFNNTTNP